MTTVARVREVATPPRLKTGCALARTRSRHFTRNRQYGVLALLWRETSFDPSAASPSNGLNCRVRRGASMFGASGEERDQRPDCIDDVCIVLWRKRRDAGPHWRIAPPGKVHATSECRDFLLGYGFADVDGPSAANRCDLAPAFKALDALKRL